MEKIATECSRPINLVMTRADTQTGELTNHEYSKPCGSRLAEKCPHCSNVYRGDAISVLQSGLKGAENSTIPFTFITFTAPGADVFGPTHQRVVETSKSGKPHVRRCGCRQVHEKDDALMGTPLDPDTYRFDRAADFNAHASRLLTVTMQRLGRVVGRKLSYARVAEFQTRGLIHFHVIVKGIVTERSVQTVVRGGVDLRIVEDNESRGPGTGQRRRNANVEAARHGEWTWGTQVDVQRVLPGGKFGVGAYLVKLLGYAVKGTDTSANGPDGHRRKMQSAALRACECKEDEEGRKRDCSLRPLLMPDGKSFYQSAPSEKFCRSHQLAFNGWGFRGHVLAFSRKWGLTFGDVRAKRKVFATVATWVSDRFIVMGWSVSSRGSPRLI
jgi:hypothetical protein